MSINQEYRRTNAVRSDRVRCVRELVRRRPWLLDLPLLLALGLGLAIRFVPSWVGLVVTLVDPQDHFSGVAAVDAPLWLFPVVAIVIMWAALRASSHAEAIAHHLRDPYGTLVLTLSAISIEVILVIEVMTTGHAQDTVARDTMFATLMLILNGLVGVSLVLGSLKHREQEFNPKSSSAYLAMIAALCSVGLILPRFQGGEPGGYMTDSMETFVAGASLALYVAFVALQSSTHREDFVVERAPAHKGRSGAGAPAAAPSRDPVPPLGRSCMLLLVSLLGVVLLSDSLGDLLVTTLKKAYLPPSLQGVFIATLILLPEGISATRSALRSDVQRTINILHGSAVSTIGLTIPAVLIVSKLIGRNAELGLEPADIALFAATLFVSMIQFGHGRTNMLQGFVHLMLFALWIVMLMDGNNGPPPA